MKTIIRKKGSIAALWEGEARGVIPKDDVDIFWIEVVHNVLVVNVLGSVKTELDWGGDLILSP